MGYSTEFIGGFRFNKRVDEKLFRYLEDFASVRHCLLDLDYIKTASPEDIKEHGFNGEAGEQGQYIAKEYEDKFTGDREKPFGPYFTDYNETPKGVPGLWCQWVPERHGGLDDPDGYDELVWDGGEKFYNYTEWLDYLICNFIAPSGYELNGTVKWQGDDMDDRGKIVVQNNVSTEIPLE